MNFLSGLSRLVGTSSQKQQFSEKAFAQYCAQGKIKEARTYLTKFSDQSFYFTLQKVFSHFEGYVHKIPEGSNPQINHICDLIAQGYLEKASVYITDELQSSFKAAFFNLIEKLKLVEEKKAFLKSILTICVQSEMESWKQIKLKGHQDKFFTDIADCMDKFMAHKELYRQFFSQQENIKTFLSPPVMKNICRLAQEDKIDESIIEITNPEVRAPLLAIQDKIKSNRYLQELKDDIVKIKQFHHIDVKKATLNYVVTEIKKELAKVIQQLTLEQKVQTQQEQSCAELLEDSLPLQKSRVSKHSQTSLEQQPKSCSIDQPKEKSQEKDESFIQLQALRQEYRRIQVDHKQNIAVLQTEIDKKASQLSSNLIEATKNEKVVKQMEKKLQEQTSKLLKCEQELAVLKLKLLDEEESRLKAMKQAKDNATLIQDSIANKESLMKTMKAKFETQLATASGKVISLETQIDQLNVIKKQYERDIAEQKKTISDLKAQLQGQSLKRKHQETAVQLAEQKNKQYLLKIEEHKKQIKQCNMRIAQYQNQAKKNLQEIDQFKEKTCVLQLESSFGGCFLNEILYRKNEERLFLCQHLMNLLKRNFSTRLLMRYDPYNKTSYHKYLDNQEHFVIIIQLENGEIIAMYCQAAHCPEPLTGDAFISSLTRREAFPLKPEKRAQVYDDFFFIMGNSEIRLRVNEKNIYSNFGAANNCFDNRGYGIEMIFGKTEKPRDAIFSMLQIYRLLFD